MMWEEIKDIGGFILAMLGASIVLTVFGVIVGDAVAFLGRRWRGE